MNLGFSEMAFLVILGLLLFGPKKLPEIGRQIGRILAEFKKASNEFQAQLNDEVRKLELEAEETKQTILPPAGTTARENPSYVFEPNPGEDANSAEHGDLGEPSNSAEHDGDKPELTPLEPSTPVAKEPNA
ncbi:MAG: sec-independent translocation protein [Candidatus Angelobacter sp.]|nr:sec-independent translocation protein [Candidatus Angelobacter sp.]